MRYAIVSDLHANIRAWDAVLADIREQGADVVVCLGDVVGYGPKPAEVLKAVRSVSSNFVMGNHDAAAVGMMDYSIFNDHARQAVEWTMTALDPEAKQFLSSVPLAIEAGEIFFVHAEISEPGRFDYISDTSIAKENFEANHHLVTFVGHTHLPKIFEQDQNGEVIELPDSDIRLEHDKRYIVNVGSVGEPRDPEDLRARYVMYDSESRDVIFRRVPFDIVSYRNDLEATSLILRPFFLRIYEEVIEGREVALSKGDGLVDMRVSHNSASLVDLGQVSGVANLSNSGAHLKSARPSRAPLAIIAIAAILGLGVLGFSLLQGRKQALPAVAEVKAEAVKKTTPRKMNAPVVQDTITPEPTPKPPEPEPTPPPPEPEPAPKPPKNEPNPKPPEPEPTPPPPKTEPLPEASNKPIGVTWWRMGDGKEVGMEVGALVDEKGQVSLFPIKTGITIRALAPDPVPENQAENSAAAQLGVWQEEKSENHFTLTADHSFTFEGWFFIGAFRDAVFLFGTRSNKEDGRGWHLDLRPRAKAHKGESICFFYDSGKEITQAIAEDIPLADGTTHHFAIVWDHDKMPDQGEMKVYLDGEEVAATNLPHAQITGEQLHSFRIGADFNRAKLGLDELRFTRKTLQPHEFLLRAPIQGATLVKANERATDNWTIPENWEDGKVPSGEQNVIIGPGLQAQINKSKPPSFAGSLVLKESSRLYLRSQESEAVLPTTEGRLVMLEDSRLALMAKGNSKLGPIELIGKGFIFGGMSTSGHHTTRTFASKITGPGELVLVGVNGNTFDFETESPFSGGVRSKTDQAQKFKVIASANGCFGKGRVFIGDHSSLRIRKDLGNTIADHASLILKGPKGKFDTKLVLYSNETVGRFVIDDVDQGKGTFNQTSHPKIISGTGTLTVE